VLSSLLSLINILGISLVTQQLARSHASSLGLGFEINVLALPSPLAQGQGMVAVRVTVMLCPHL